MNIKKYKLISESLEAVRLTPDNLELVAEWCHGSIKGTSLPRNKRCVDFYTFQGEERAEIGDWIIKGVDGLFYLYSNEIFVRKYEEVN